MQVKVYSVVYLLAKHFRFLSLTQSQNQSSKSQEPFSFIQLYLRPYPFMFPQNPDL